MKRSDQDAINDLLEDAPAEALALVRELKAESADPDLAAFEAECLSELRRFGDAIATWATYLELDPQYLGAYVERGRLLVEIGEVKAADSELRAAVELFGQQAPIAFQQGFLADVLGDFEGADVHYETAAELDVMFDPPAHFSAKELGAALDDAFDEERVISVVAMPADAGTEGFGRLFDRSGRKLTVFSRNVEREVGGVMDAETLADYVVDAVAEAEEEN